MGAPLNTKYLQHNQRNKVFCLSGFCPVFRVLKRLERLIRQLCEFLRRHGKLLADRTLLLADAGFGECRKLADSRCLIGTASATAWVSLRSPPPVFRLTQHLAHCARFPARRSGNAELRPVPGFPRTAGGFFASVTEQRVASIPLRVTPCFS